MSKKEQEIYSKQGAECKNLNFSKTATLIAG